MAKQANTQRKNRFEIFFSDEEKEALLIEAKRQGVPQTQVLRGYIRQLMWQQQEQKAAS